MGRASVAVIVLVGLLGACLVGIGIGYLAPKTFEKNFVPTPSTIFQPVDITIEELRAKESVTVQEYVSLQLAADEEKSDTADLEDAVAYKTLEPFEGSVGSAQPVGTDECLILVFSDDFPVFRTLMSVSPDWCSSLGINSKVWVSGTIGDPGLENRPFVLFLHEPGISVR